MVLPADLQQALLQTGLEGLQTSWGIPEVVVPLSERERAHMFNHPIASHVMPDTREEQDAFFKQFCISLLQAVGSKMATSCYMELKFSELSIEQTTVEIPDDLELPDFDFDVEECLVETPAKEPAVGQSSSFQVETSTMKEATKDPSNSTMQKIAASKVTSLAGKVVGHEIDQGLKSLGDPAKNARFLNYAKKTLGAAIASAKFLSAVEEKGWRGAAGELAIKFSTGLIAKYGAKIVTNAVGCTNPVYCAGLLADVIVSSLEPTETASQFHDGQPPLAFPNMPLGSQLPQLDPLYPTIRNPK